MQLQRQTLSLALLCCACVTRVEPPAAAFSCDAAGGSGSDQSLGECAHTPPSVPDTDTLCKLVLLQSTEDDVKALLGPPNDAWGSQAGGGQISYDFAGNANLTFGFDQSVFCQAMVYDVSYPQCWQDEADARLRAAEQPQMNSQP